MKASQNVSLREYNTFGFNVKAKEVFQVDSTEDVLQLIQNGVFRKKHLILGGGSNVLLRDDFDGAIVLNRIGGFEIVREDSDSVQIRVGAGENWHKTVIRTVENGWGGLENLSLIPGSVGAAPMQNIGAYGVEIKSCFVQLHAVHLESGEIETFTNAECEFGYRESIFKRAAKGKYLIVNVDFELQKNPVFHIEYGAIRSQLQDMGTEKLSVKAISDAVIAIRQSKLPDPKEIGNSGSFFKNPVISIAHYNRLKNEYAELPAYPVDDNQVKVPAGWLIDQAGWKGYRDGDIGVHKNQALVLVNYGSGNGTDVHQLSEKIIADIKERYDIELEREVNVI
jgi:UDP-N-acetylmuramate dehydrogenase